VPTLFSYVVDHDHGFAPNPYSHYCTLVHCKFGGSSGRRSIVEMAKVGDWIVGTGGRSKKSSGTGTVLYLMRVDEKLPFWKFLSDKRFRGRPDCVDLGRGNKFALVSQNYFYFGRHALKTSRLPAEIARKELVKTGPGFRRDYPSAPLKRLVAWFGSHFEIGMHGDPCAVRTTQAKSRGQRNAKKKIRGNDRGGGCDATSSIAR
jgi:hypothetical protein